MAKTNEHFIRWDNRNNFDFTAHPSAEAAERYFRRMENIPDDVTIEQYHEIRDAVEESGAEAPPWMNTRDNYSHIIGQIDIVEDET